MGGRGRSPRPRTARGPLAVQRAVRAHLHAHGALSASHVVAVLVNLQHLRHASVHPSALGATTSTEQTPRHRSPTRYTGSARARGRQAHRRVLQRGVGLHDGLRRQVAGLARVQLLTLALQLPQPLHQLVRVRLGCCTRMDQLGSTSASARAGGVGAQRTYVWPARPCWTRWRPSSSARRASWAGPTHAIRTAPSWSCCLHGPAPPSRPRCPPAAARGQRTRLSRTGPRPSARGASAGARAACVLSARARARLGGGRGLDARGACRDNLEGHR
jgi:hypothetical protein